MEAETYVTAILAMNRMISNWMLRMFFYKKKVELIKPRTVFYSMFYMGLLPNGNYG